MITVNLWAYVAFAVSFNVFLFICMRWIWAIQKKRHMKDIDVIIEKGLKEYRETCQEIRKLHLREEFWKGMEIPK